MVPGAVFAELPKAMFIRQSAHFSERETKRSGPSTSPWESTHSLTKLNMRLL
jgi:hypothetical protein